MFMNIVGEFEDFLGTSLSGASLPFSLKDPRRGGNRSLSEIEYRSVDLDVSNTLIRRCFPDYLQPAGVTIVPKPIIMTPAPAASHEIVCPAKVEQSDKEFDEDDNLSTTSEQTDSSGVNDLLLPKLGERFEYSSKLDDPPKRSNSTVSRLIRRGVIPPKLSIKTFDLSNNSMTSIDALLKIRHSPQLMRTFSQLTKLNLSRNKLSHINSEIWSLMNHLTDVDLNDNKLDEFPVALLKYCPLETLDVSNNLISDIPICEESIELMSQSSVTFSLKIFLLANNSLATFPTALINNLFGLEELSLKGNRLRELPNMSFMLKRLKSLSLANNYIKCVPEDFLGGFPNLQTLNMSCNELENLPSGNTVDKLTSLITLKLDHNQLATKEPFYIPNFILRLISLRYLDLSNNQLTGFPSPEKWSTQNLCELVLAHNQIQELVLTNAQNHWRHLERLAISHNKLKKIPPETGHLSNMSRLDISYNSQMVTLPDELGKLAGKLWDMPLDGLKLNFDEALLKPPRRNLLGYLHNRLKKSVEYYGLKLMLVGYGGKGKTSLLRALTKEKTIREAQNNVATLGINVQLWKYPCRHRGQSVDYRFSCWDFAGQEDFYSTHQCFLSKRAVYLVVYDLSKREKELKCLEPWLLNIRAQAPGSPVIIVGTHVDTIPDKERNNVFFNLRQRINAMCQSGNFPKIWDFAEVDARRDNFTVEQLRIKLVEVLEEFTINGECVMGQKIPASFVRLEELIRGVASSLPAEKPILQHKQILKIVKDANLDLDETELQQAVRFLHDSGVLLHFDDTAHGLNNLYFVDPQWLCRMMAQVVTVRDVNPFIVNGVMRVEDLKLLFTGRKIIEGDRVFVFPTNHIAYYLRLLEKFEVALLEGDDKLLIPSRLPSSVPVFRELHNKESSNSVIYREYRMTFLPTGFWPRLIARLHALLGNFHQYTSSEYKDTIRVALWNRGFYSYWGRDEYFVVEGWYTDKENLRIRTAKSKIGVKLLVQLIDCVDILIEEWFPGLLEVDLSGGELLQRIIPCPHCQASSQSEKQLFYLTDVIVQSEMEDWVTCPLYKRNHPDTEKISFSWLVPDVLLTDLNPEFQLDPEKLQLLQTHEYLLGQGTFGSVYRATYKDEACAVKMFASSGTDIPLHRLLRQEVEVLRRLQHPSLIQLLAVDRHFIVLELAPMGSLSAILSQKRIRSRRLIHRIGLQVTEGLAFLHKNSIIYRDLKPENVLVYSLNTERSLVNVKLSDYGISRLITPYGFVQEIGTPGFMAPEVIRSQQYDLSADIYSLGILFYTLVTDGKHPFEDPGFPERGNYNEAILMGRKPDAIYKQNASTWPDLQNLISQCLETNPVNRPTVQTVLNQLRSVEFITLRQRIPVTKEDNIDCMSVRMNENSHIEIFTASGGDRLVQLSWNDLNTGKSRGALIKDYRVLCTLSCNHHILLGTQSGRIWVYHIFSDTCIHSVGPLGDAVLALTHYGSSNQDSLVIAGLANGDIVILNRTTILQTIEVVPEYINVGDCPVRCMCTYDGKVYLSCGNVIHIFKKNKEQDFYTIAELCIVGSDHKINKRKLVNCIKVQNNSIFASIWGDSKVYHYDTNGEMVSEPFDIHKLVGDWYGEQISQGDCRVTCILVWHNNRYMAVGTGGGYFLVMDITDQYHVLVGRYKDAIRAIDRINLTTKNKSGSSTIDRSMRMKSSSSPVLPDDVFSFSLLDSSLTELDNPDRLTSCLIVSGLAFHSGFDIGKTDTCAFLTIWQDDILEEHRRLQNDILGRDSLTSNKS